MGSRIFLFFVFFVFISSCTSKSSKPTNPTSVLVFSKTKGYRHASIEDGIEMIKSLGQEYDFGVAQTENSNQFTDDILKNYSLVIFLSTTGDVFNEKQQEAFQRYISAGGTYLGIHAASDTEYKWPWYGRLVGGYFNGHPNNPNVRDASINILKNDHISCAHLSDPWKVTDEWYNFKNLNSEVEILLNLDETSYEGGTNGKNHPISWCHDFDGGRAFYTGMGHTKEAFSDTTFKQHILGGIQYCLAFKNGIDYSKKEVYPDSKRFEKIVFDDYFAEPVELDVLPNNKLIFIERKGMLRIHNIENKETKLVDSISVYSKQEDGLIGMALDPNFEKNNWIYLYYSPVETVGDYPYNRLSRFTLDQSKDFGMLQDENVLLDVKTQREECCHAGGSIEFGPDGLLYLTTGDDTNPFESSGFAPIDDRDGRSPFDARRTSANTQDLRGKILRVQPEDNGSYSIPAGNLFTNNEDGRSEIYVMGCRNPYRISIDKKTNYLYWGDVGPDSNKDDPNRGPKGHDEINQAKKAGFFGWPLFVGNNKAYTEYDFDTTKSVKEEYDPIKPINNSVNNTGLQNLPPAQPAMVYYPYGESDVFPLMTSGGRNAMAGPIYYYDDYPDNPTKLPKYYNGKFLAYDWMRGLIVPITFDQNKDYAYMERMAPNIEWNNLIDLAFGPDGTLYFLEYGKGWFTKNKDARIGKLEYNNGNRKPTPIIKLNKDNGAIPLTVDFNADASFDDDNDKLKYLWTFGDGSTSKEMNPTHTFIEPGKYTIELKVHDKNKSTATTVQSIIAGNTTPKVEIDLSNNGSFYWPNQTTEYEVRVNDAEDGIIGEGIDGDKIQFKINYLGEGFDLAGIAQGHQEQLDALSPEELGLQSMNKSDCAICHKKDTISIGPSYMEIADRYIGKETADVSLAIINGSSGKWGEGTMAAHPDITEEQAHAMLTYILSLGNETEEIRALKGTFSFNIPSGEPQNGHYAMTASYRDKGAIGTEKLDSRFTKLLLNHKVSGQFYSKAEEATSQNHADNNGKYYSGVEMNEKSHVFYGPYNLNNVESVDIHVLNLGDSEKSLECYINDKLVQGINLNPQNDQYNVKLTEYNEKESSLSFKLKTEGEKDIVLLHHLIFQK